MRKSPKTPDRLHPKLRVYRNANDAVNAARSQISSCVASVWKEPAVPAAELPFSIELATLQEGMRDLSLDPKRTTRGRLPKRPKLKTAKEAFVNVFVEVERDAAHDGDAAIGIARQLRNELDGVSKAGGSQARSPAIQRRNFVSATVPVSMLPTLEKDTRIAFVHRAEPLKLDVPTAGDPDRAPKSRAIQGHTDHDDVLIGIIDVGGFDFAHPDFL